MSEPTALSNGLVTVRVHADEGTFDVLDAAGRSSVVDAAISVVLVDGTAFSSRGAPFRLAGRPELVEGEALAALTDVSDG